MIRTSLLAAASLGASLLSVPATAQDFSGFRAEVRAGYDAVSTDDNYEDIADSLSGTGFALSVGYDHDIMPGYTLGVEAGVLIPSGTEETVELGSDTLSFESKRDLEVLVRFGRVINDKTLIFAKAGYANSRIEAVYTSLAPNEIERTHEDYGGLRLGFGGERQLSARLSATAEYRFTRYDDDAVSRNQILIGLAYRF